MTMSGAQVPQSQIVIPQRQSCWNRSMLRAAGLTARSSRLRLQTRKEEGPKQHMSFEEAVVSAIDFHGALTGTGSYAPPMEARGGKHKGGGVGPSPAYSYSAQVAEVSVDEETGEVTVHKVWAAHDCGRALNPVAVEGQVVGSVWMGLGQAMQEEMVWKDGLMMNPGLLEYRSPSSVESPEIETIIVESIDPEGPFGAKEAGRGFAGCDDSCHFQRHLPRCGSQAARSAFHSRARVGCTTSKTR